MIQPRYDGFWHRSLGCMDRISLVAFLRDETGNCHFRLISALCGLLLHKLEYVTKRRYIFLVVKNLIQMDSLCRRNDVCSCSVTTTAPGPDTTISKLLFTVKKRGYWQSFSFVLLYCTAFSVVHSDCIG